MTHHVFGHKDLDVLLTVVNHERVPNKFRHDGAGAGPGLDGFLFAGLIQSHDLGIKLLSILLQDDYVINGLLIIQEA